MSYDLTIKPDESFSRSISLRSLDEFLNRIEGVVKSGCRCSYNYGDPAGPVFIEIDADMANLDGDSILDNNSCNRVLLHISAAFFESSQLKALELARSIAQELGWIIYDEQTDRQIDDDTVSLSQPVEKNIPVKGRRHHIGEGMA